MRYSKVSAAIILCLIVSYVALFTGCAMAPDNNGGGTIVGNPEKHQNLEQADDGAKTLHTLDAEDERDTMLQGKEEKDENKTN